MSTASYRGTSGDCDPGISSNLTTNSSGPDEDGFYSVSKSAIKYHVKNNPGASFNVTCAPSASVTAAGMPGGQATVSYKVEAWAVNIAVGGTTADPGDENIRKILPGQKVTGVVVYGDGAPLTPALDETSDPPVHETTWTISDCSPFLDYVVASGSATGTLTTYAPQKGATGWAFWAKPGTGTVACEHKMKLTEGPETVFPVSLERTVPVADLAQTQAIAGGAGGEAFCVELGQGRHIGFEPMNFSGRLVTPEMFIVNGDPGSWDFVQMITQSDRGYMLNSQQYSASTNFSGPAKLDGDYPYASGGPAVASTAYTLDSPNYGVLSAIDKIWMKDGFNMYWIYTPPVVNGSASRPVPVRSRSWQVSIEATAPNWVPTGLLSGGAFYSLGTLLEWPAHPQWTAKVQ